MTIVPLSSSDWPKIIAWIKGSYWGGWQSTVQLRAALKHSMTFVAIREGKVLGFIRIVTDYATFSSITDLYVDEPHRRQGVATALLRHVMEHTGVPEAICILTSRDARALYAKFGFVSIGGEVMKRDPSA
jgi:ribosomal protein S18 acetylase RimI-like enzyme